jgi:hypothetical protein
MMLIVITKTAKSFAVCKTFADFKNLVCRIFETRTKYREERIEGFQTKKSVFSKGFKTFLKHELNTEKNESKGL